VSVVFQFAAFAAHSPLRQTSYAVLLWVSIATFLPTLLGRRESDDSPVQTSVLRRVVYAVSGLNWFVWSTLWIILISLDPHSVVSAPNFVRPFSLWRVSAGVYESFYLAWQASFAILFFSPGAFGKRPTSVVAHPRARPEERLLPRGLKKGVLVGIFAPPVALYLIGYLLQGGSLDGNHVAEALITISTFWILLALLLVAITLIVSGVLLKSSVRR
jgi:hypothetical protein